MPPVFSQIFSPQKPSAPPQPDMAAMQAQQKSQALQRGAGQTIANATAQGLSGSSPQFLANMNSQNAGFNPQGNEDQSLQAIMQYLNGGGRL